MQNDQIPLTHSHWNLKSCKQKKKKKQTNRELVIKINNKYIQNQQYKTAGAFYLFSFFENKWRNYWEHIKTKVQTIVIMLAFPRTSHVLRTEYTVHDMEIALQETRYKGGSPLNKAYIMFG